MSITTNQKTPASNSANKGKQRFTNILWSGEDYNNPQEIKAALIRAGFISLTNQKEAIKIAVRLMLGLFEKDPNFLTAKAEAPAPSKEEKTEEIKNPLF